LRLVFRSKGAKGPMKGWFSRGGRREEGVDLSKEGRPKEETTINNNTLI